MSNKDAPLNPELKSEKKKYKAEKEAAELRIKKAKAIELETKLQKAREKAEIENLNAVGMFGSPTEPRKSLSTFLRNQNKAEISIVTIIDRKAAILIRICTTMVSGLIVFHRYIDQNVNMGPTISSVLMIGMLGALITSILATKPFVSFYRKIFEKEIQPIHPNIEENNFFLPVKISLKEYEESMVKVAKSQDLQIGNQIRGNYLVATSNMYKSKLVDLSYSIFLVSFLVAGVIFIYSRFS